MRKLVTLTVLSVVSGAALLAAGCAADENRPYALSGDTADRSSGVQYTGSHGQPPQEVPGVQGRTYYEPRSDSNYGTHRQPPVDVPTGHN